MKLIDFKVNFLLNEEKCQVIFFDKNGYLIDSCDTIIALSDYKEKQSTVPIPIIDNIHEILKDTPDDEQLIFPRVEINFPHNPTQILDLILTKKRNDADAYYICVMRDEVMRYEQLQEIVTEQRATAMEKELLEIKHEKTALENELILMKNQELERAKAMKNDFFAKASHELRTPVNGILGLAEMLEETATEQQQGYLKALVQVATQLKTIVNDLLDLSKLEEKKITFEQVPFNLGEIFNNIALAFKSLADKKEIKLLFSIDEKIPDYLLGDITRISQIIYNLVSNSLKFTEKGEVRVAASLEEITVQNKFRIKFVVQDTGVGIAADKLASIFEPYTQESNETYRLYGGTGLGLTIVKQLIEAMGGQIFVESKANQGTTFYFELVFEQSKPISTLQDKSIMYQYANRSVLIADDNEINLMVVTKKMQNIGFDVETAKNGQEVLQKLENKHYDLLCLDMNMPILNGSETIKAIRNKTGSPFQTIPIFLMTAYSYTDIAEKIKDIQITDFLTKPFEMSDLLQKLQKHLPPKQPSDYELSLNLSQIQEFSQGDTAFEKELMQQVINVLDELKKDYQNMISKEGQINSKAINDLVHKYNMIFAMINEDTLKEEIDSTLSIYQSAEDKGKALQGLQRRIFQLCDEVREQARQKI
ncbi:ATP-binding protein [Thermoflexibacter ruber]|uniref:histidine kinase n=1 Tax=Thermoflexibacter ruber TaxID=1003 RepID=A0A1I2GNS1_9BACT|nr:ATP-binding protein [Thermoflexibacter ruber]SFF19215.1 Signal transduction histidine kinase [Thermoflexibacter ruber]